LFDESVGWEELTNLKWDNCRTGPEKGAVNWGSLGR